MNWLDGCVQRVAVNFSTSSWKPVMNGVPKGFILGLILLNIFISNTDGGF